MTDEHVLFPEAGTNPWPSSAPDPGGFFADCEVVVPRPIVNQRVAPVPLETRAAAAAWGDGRFRSGDQPEPQGATRDRQLLDPTRLVHLIPPDVGGGFGAKSAPTWSTR